jgi:hypothetical protein
MSFMLIVRRFAEAADEVKERRALMQSIWLVGACLGLSGERPNVRDSRWQYPVLVMIAILMLANAPLHP